jgi:hypothetical protein
MASNSNKLYRRSGLTSDGEVVHHIYVDETANTYVSTTNVLSERSDKEKDERIENWKQQNNGENGTEHHEDLLKYSQLRGTLLHYEAQKKYTEADLWGIEEEQAKQELQEFGEFKGEDAWERYQREKSYFVDEIHSMLDPEIDELIAVEAYCYHRDPSYAGQVDLVYRNTDDEVVVCDLKTSKQMDYSYLLQTNAYARIVENAIDEKVAKLQVARANPDISNANLHTQDRTDCAITFSELIQTEYGYKILVDSPYEAKQAIKNLDWDLHHQSWNTENKKWTIAITNRDDLITFDFARIHLQEQNWSVQYEEGVLDQIFKKTTVSPEDVSIDKSELQTYGEHLSAEFDALTQSFEQKPFTFPEDIIQDYASDLLDEAVTDSLEFIETHKGSLGDRHPYTISGAVLVVSGVCIDTVTELLNNPQNLSETVSQYNDL